MINKSKTVSEESPEIEVLSLPISKYFQYNWQSGKSQMMVVSFRENLIRNTPSWAENLAAQTLKAMVQTLSLKGAIIEELPVKVNYLFQRGNIKLIQVRDASCNINK